MLFGALALSSAQTAAVISGGSIAGFVYADLNNNGIKDAGEPGIAGVTITLSGDDDAKQRRRTRTARIRSLPSNDCCEYTVTETQPAGSPTASTRSGWAVRRRHAGQRRIHGHLHRWRRSHRLQLWRAAARNADRAAEAQDAHTDSDTNGSAEHGHTHAGAATSTPQPSATKPGGRRGEELYAPDTGMGGSGGRDTTTTGIVFAALALLVAGGAVAGRGVWQRTWRQR